MGRGSSASVRGDIVEREGTRLVYNDCCQLIEIRAFRHNAKIGDPVKSTRFYYDDCCNITNILYEDTRVVNNCVNNLDILVPEQPIITSTNPVSPGHNNPIINGTCGTGAVGEIVKDNDIVKIYHAEDKTLLGTGPISSNTFSFSIDLSSYSSGNIIPLIAFVENERNTRHGSSQGSIEFYYTLS